MKNYPEQGGKSTSGGPQPLPLGLKNCFPHQIDVCYGPLLDVKRKIL